MTKDTFLNILSFYEQILTPLFVFVVIWTAGILILSAIRGQKLKKYIEEKYPDLWKESRPPANSVIFALKLFGWYKDSKPFIQEDQYIKNYVRGAKLLLKIYFIPWGLLLLALLGLVVILFSGFS